MRTPAFLSSRPISDSLLAAIGDIDRRLAVDREEFPPGSELREKIDALLQEMLDLQHALDNAPASTVDELLELPEPAMR